MLRDLFRIKRKYDRIANSEKAESSYSFAVSVIILSFLMCAFAAGIGLFFKMSGSDDDLSAIVGLIMAIFMLLCLASVLLWATIDLVYQFKLNKKPMSWVALAFYLLGIIGSVVAVILLM